MTRSWHFLVACLVTSGALAGCVGGDDAPTDDVTLGSDDDAATGAPEGRGAIIAFEETNATEEGAGGDEHNHDMWRGLDRVNFVATDGLIPIYGYVPDRYADEVYPAAGDLVLEATSRVEVLLSDPRVAADQVSSPNPPAVTFSYKHAAADDWIEVGPVAWGVPVTVDITHPTQTDMPHATYSLWAFRIHSQSQEAQGLLYNITADIIRGPADIPLWPGHPDFYAESDSRLVLDTTTTTGENGVVGDAAPIAFDDQGAVKPDRLISYGTRTLHIYLNISNFAVTNPADQPTNFFLEFSNASGRLLTSGIFDVEGHPISQTAHEWTLKVEDSGMDSPYAPESRWTFKLGAAFFTGAAGRGVSCFRNCATWTADYSLAIIATDHELPEDAYDAVD